MRCACKEDLPLMVVVFKCLHNLFTHHTVPLTLAPRLGNMLGGTAVLVSGPCLEETDQITCMFGERSVNGLYISEMLSVCVSPTISTTGRVRFQLIVQTNGTSTDRYRGESVFYSGKYLT